MKYDIVNMSGKLMSRLRKLENDRTILPKNKQTIYDFDAYLMSLGLTDSRRYKYLTLLSWLSRELKKPFGKATKKDLMELIGRSETSRMAEWTKADRRVTTKRFYKWLKGNDEEYPDEVKWIKCHIKNRLVKLPEELITEEEVKRMADAARRPRDKAFVQVLYESGCRIAEMLSLQMKNIIFDEFGAVLRVTGKTGDRRVRIVASAPALATWVDFHPYKGNPDAYMWVRNLHKNSKDYLPFRYIVAVKLLRTLGLRAGITKKVNPHAFRHSRATALANKLTEAQMKEYFGWVQGSDMASVYVHLSGRDVDNAILDIYGLRKDTKTETEKFSPAKCPRCGASNSPASKLCTKCGYTTSLEVAIKAEEETKKNNDLLGELMKDPEFKELMLRKLVEKNIGMPEATE